MPRTEPPANGSSTLPPGGQNQRYASSHSTGSKIDVPVEEATVCGSPPSYGCVVMFHVAPPFNEAVWSRIARPSLLKLSAGGGVQNSLSRNSCSVILRPALRSACSLRL